jgi:hypothetical protein
MGNFNKEGQIKVRGSFSKRCPRKFCSEAFYNGDENLIQMPNIILNWHNQNQHEEPNFRLNSHSGSPTAPCQ